MSNSAVRALSGTGFVIIMLFCLLFSKFTFAVLVMLITVGMMVEFYRMTMGDSYVISRILAIVAAVSLFVLIFCRSAFGMDLKFIALAMAPIFLIMINSLYVKDKSEFGRFSNIYTALLYIAAPMALSNLIVFQHGRFSRVLLICFFIIIWASDIGAYTFGIALGKRFPKKLFESISPKKTWIGYWGGLIMAVVAACILFYTGYMKYPLIHCIVLAVVMHIAGVWGDLFESQWKRFYNVKDSGNIIPGHGGLLDRFDSTLMAMPIGAVYLAIFNLL